MRRLHFVAARPGARGIPLERFLIWATTTLLGLALASEGAAQFKLSKPLSTSRVVLPPSSPTGGRMGGRGFDATIELSSMLAAGYVGFNATLASNVGPLAATRNLVVRLTPIDRHLPANQTIAADIPLTFEQGRTEIVVERSIPKWTIGNTFRVEILEDGVPLDDYTAELGSAIPAYATRSPQQVLANEWLNNILFVETTPPTSTRPPNLLFELQPESASWQSKSLLSLPTDWRLLREVDCIVIESEAWIGFDRKEGEDAKADPAADRLHAIREWVMMGGTLVVLSAPEVRELEQRMRLAVTQSAQEDQVFRSVLSSRFGEIRYRLASWRRTFDLAAKRPAGMRPSADLGSTARPAGQVQFIEVESGVFQEIPSNPTQEQLAATRQWLADQVSQTTESESNWESSYRCFAGTGQVIGLPAAIIDRDASFAILDELVGFHKSPMLERGVDPIMGDARSRNWLIPGVSEPPVYTFIGILTLFVLLVGPVAYRWTTKGHRSHLMFLIAPLLALLTTASMFTYSIVSDGFGTVTRVRQLTWIDGASGDAVERTRTTLFSGISPRTGIQFSSDAEIMSYPSGRGQTWRELRSDVNEVRLRVVVGESTQRLGSAALASRTQTQFVSHQVRRGLGTLSLTGLIPFDENGLIPNPSTVELTSTLPFELRELVFRSSDGQYWRTLRIPPGETVQADRIANPRDASKLMGELYIRHAPIGSVSRAGRSRQDQQIGDLILFINREINRGGAVVTSGAFEDWLNRSLFVKGELSPGMFVAIADPSRDVAAVEGAEQVASVRYVMGTLQQ